MTLFHHALITSRIEHSPMLRKKKLASGNECPQCFPIMSQLKPPLVQIKIDPKDSTRLDSPFYLNWCVLHVPAC